MRLPLIALAAILSCSIARAETGTASWYGSESGTHTASGHRFNPHGMTAAHRTLPFGTKVKIYEHRTGKAVTCVVNDRGPAKWTKRVIDLSRGCAAALGIVARGTATVTLEVVD